MAPALNDEEMQCLEWLENWRHNNPSVNFEKRQLARELGFANEQLDRVLRKMEGIGAVDPGLVDISGRANFMGVTSRCPLILGEIRGHQKKWWSERVEKLVWLIIGAVIGIVATLVSQWLLHRK